MQKILIVVDMQNDFIDGALVTVDAACCAGATPEGHKTALAAMKACQIQIINE